VASKKTLVMSLVLLALLAVAFFAEGPWREKDRGGEEAPMVFTGNDTAGVTRVEVTGQDGKVTIQKGDGGWEVVKGEKRYPADSEGVERVLEQLPELNRGTVSSRNPDSHEKFMVDEENGVLVKVFNGEDNKAGFYVGKQGPDFFSSYIRNLEDDRVLLVKGQMKPLFDKRLKEWRDMKIVSFESGEASLIEIIRPDGSLVLEKKEGGRWTVTLPEEAAADGEAMDDLISRLSSLKAVDALEEPEGDYGLEDPALKIRVVLEGGREAGVDFGNKIEEKNRYYARARDGRTIFMVGQFNYKKLNLTLQDLLAEGDQEETEEPPSSG